MLLIQNTFTTEIPESIEILRVSPYAERQCTPMALPWQVCGEKNAR